MYAALRGLDAGKTRKFGSVTELLAKLEGRAVLWENVARDAKDRAAEFERAAQEAREGAPIVIVGRTTYVLE